MKNSFFNRFSPKEPKFFPLLKQMSEVVITASDLLVECIKCTRQEDRIAYYKKIKDQERMGDQVCRKIFEELSTTFITPFDREDINHLSSYIDDVTDGINSSAKRIAIYNPKHLSDSALELAMIIKKDAYCISEAMNELEVLRKKPAKLMEHCSELHELENQADDVYETFIIRLFEEEKDSIELIKVKEIMHELEKTTDAAEHVGKLIKTIIVKYA